MDDTLVENVLDVLDAVLDADGSRPTHGVIRPPACLEDVEVVYDGGEAGVVRSAGWSDHRGCS